MTKFHLLVKQFHNLHYLSQLLYVGDLEDDSTSQNSNAVVLSTVIIITEKPAYLHPRMVSLFKLDCECGIHHIIMKNTYIYIRIILTGSTMSVWTTSLVNTQEVINMLLDKYRVECPSNNFSMFVVKDNGGIHFFSLVKNMLFSLY